MADKKTWAEQFPDPGPEPPRPTTGRLTPELQHYNAWVRAFRKHRVAKAVDRLREQEHAGEPLSATDTIALIFGTMLLDGSMTSNDIFSGLFG